MFEAVTHVFWSLQRGRARAGAELDLEFEWQNLVVSFNGAAPARARNFGSGTNGGLFIYTLQRGRARAGAELKRARPPCANARRLQRGRARAGAEFKPRIVVWDCQYDSLQRGRARAGAELPVEETTTKEPDMLQRGRARAGAELRWPTNKPPARRNGFNGAAPARARNWKHVIAER